MAKKADLSQLTPEERAIVEARRAYKRAWRKANADRVKEHERRFYARRAAQNNTRSQGKK